MRMLITELPFGQRGRVFRSPMPFGKYDQEGVIYEAYYKHAISLIVLLVEDREKEGRDSSPLAWRAGHRMEESKVLHI